MNRQVVQLALAALVTYTASAAAQPKEQWFARSGPFHGNQSLYVSDEVCPIKLAGVSKALLDRFQVKALSSTQGWRLAMVDSKYGQFPACWTNIEKSGEAGTLHCVVSEGKITEDCFIMAESYFRSLR